MKNLDKLQEISDQELEIHTENAAALLGDLKDHARLQAKYYRWASQAQKRVDDLSLKLEMAIVEIIEEIIHEAEDKGKPIPYSSRSELKRIAVPKDERYQLSKNRLNSAMEEMNYLQGLVRAFEAKGFRLQEVVRLMFNQLRDPEVRVYSKDLESLANSIEYETPEKPQ